MKVLFIIPARSGSKGIPHKNIKVLGGKPLIGYAIDCARAFVPDSDICVSTDGQEIIDIVKQYGLEVPFVRPDKLASDHSGTYEVLLHAIQYYQDRGLTYDAIVLLQPTSPFREKEDVKACLEKYKEGKYEMVVSVKEAATNPYYACFEPDEDGYLHHSKGDGTIIRRQDAPKVYEYNGAVYVMSVQALLTKSYLHFERIGYHVMDERQSMDLDTLFDWELAEKIIQDKEKE